MHRAALPVVAAVVLFAGVAGGVAANEPPLPDAGLDQSAETGETVRLDATGSRDPDGTVATYAWTVEHPNGTTTRLDCTDCGTPTFTPTRSGQYNLTVTVTDDDGAARSDTLYLTVTDTAGPTTPAGPSVSLSGVANPIRGQTVTYTADATAGDAPLEEIAMYVDGRRVAQWRANGDTETVRYDHRATHTTARQLRVNVTDTADRSDTATLRVTPWAMTSPAGVSPGDYYDPNADGGQGAWVETTYDGDGNMVVENQAGRTEADAYNYVMNNGVASNTYSNPGPNPTTSEVGAVAQEVPFPIDLSGGGGSGDSGSGGNSGGGADRGGGGGGGGLSIGGINIEF